MTASQCRRARPAHEARPDAGGQVGRPGQGREDRCPSDQVERRRTVLELDPQAAGDGADEVMCGRARADRLRRELEHDAGMVANALVDGRERRLVGDREREVMQTDIGLAIEGDRVFRIGDTPNGERHAAIGDEHGRVGVVPGDFLEAQSSAEEARGLVEVANGEANVVHTVGQSVGQNSILSCWMMGRFKILSPVRLVTSV